MRDIKVIKTTEQVNEQFNIVKGGIKVGQRESAT